MKKNILFLLAALGIAGCNSGGTVTVNTPTCNAPAFTPQTAATLLNNWGNGLIQYNAQNNANIFISAGYFTMSFYYLDATLQPTLNAVQRTGINPIYDYFATSFLPKNPIMTIPNPESNIAYSLDCGYGGYAGYYDFKTYPGTDHETTTHARFTFVFEYEPQPFISSFVAESGPTLGQTYYQSNNPGWYILIQHSSILP